MEISRETRTEQRIIFLESLVLEQEGPRKKTPFKGRIWPELELKGQELRMGNGWIEAEQVKPGGRVLQYEDVKDIPHKIITRTITTIVEEREELLGGG